MKIILMRNINGDGTKDATAMQHELRIYKQQNCLAVLHRYENSRCPLHSR